MSDSGDLRHLTDKERNYVELYIEEYLGYVDRTAASVLVKLGIDTAREVAVSILRQANAKIYGEKPDKERAHRLGIKKGPPVSKRPDLVAFDPN